MNTKQKVFNLLKENKKRELSKKVDLGLIDEFDWQDIRSLEDEASNLNYLAYDWFDEKFDEFRNAFSVINDVFQNGAGNEISYADVINDEERLKEIVIKADELGLAPQEVYDEYDEHIRLIQEIKEADQRFLQNQQRFDQYIP
tara:strand:+ start:977 stop:1405 length:429 start_codon:yes stop_codon:yes gene_type:complete